MRLGTVTDGVRELPVVDRPDGRYVLDAPAGWDLSTVLAAGPEEIQRLGESASLEAPDTPLTAPLRPGKIVAVGLNYLDHIRETRSEAPQRPLLFTKFTSSVIGDGDPIVVDDQLTERVDWEVELAVVIGRPLRNVGAEEALAGVAGYCVANDVSARDLQFADGQWVRGKSLDTFCPLGPVVVTPDEIGDPQALGLRTVVNGEVVQDSSTAEMLFSVADLLVFCARAFTLLPGDIVLTGTPFGCGEFMSPRRFLRPGDVVEVSIDKIGSLRNPVVAAVPAGQLA